MTPMDAAIKGAGEIGFTIVSISLSLIAVFIPLLLMGGIVGRLFREFAMTVSITVVVSALVSLTLTPMMCSRFLVERSRPAWPALPDGGGDVRRDAGILSHHARHRAALSVYHADGVHRDGDGHRGAVRHHSEGLLSDPGCRPDHRHFRRRAGLVVRHAWSSLQQQLNDIVAHDPAVASFASQVGAGTGGQQGNDGRMYINLKPWDQRPGDDVMKVIARLSEKAQAVPGVQLFMQPAQDINVGGRLSRTLYQFTLAGRRPCRAERLGAEDAATDAGAVQDCATSPPISRSPARPRRSPSTATPHSASASSRSRSTTHCTMRSASAR